MKINLEIKINVKWDEEKDTNSVSVSTSLDNSFSEVLTALKMAENNIKNSLSILHERDKPEDLDTWLKTIKIGDLNG